ncbi:MAG: OmpA family protein [Proteobacteria bacterium]|jgi:peptidoglycan-associated lipoprotein|nr:OmpA family protein [Pseudomonadota bacterium]MDA1012198.1 OmpA family protein [Pseudomonadota bacterium]|tara:strand:+ start:1327 stop:1995 length:669 start_codon:yes stop_codon:yes gene_type:complete
MTMKFLLVAGLVAVLVGCSSKTKTNADIEQRDLFDQSNRRSFEQTAESIDGVEAPSEEELRAQQDELKREFEREEQRLLDERVKLDEQNAATQDEFQRQAEVKRVLSQNDSLLSQRSIFYDFDSSVIKVEFQPVIEAHGSFLKKHPTVRIRIEGNCDDRGSREYNLALGQSRAEQLKQAFVLLGARADQIDVASYGAERPLVFGIDDESRSKNRRSDLVYLD